jgi:hypothetical protein
VAASSLPEINTVPRIEVSPSTVDSELQFVGNSVKGIADVTNPVWKFAWSTGHQRGSRIVGLIEHLMQFMTILIGELFISRAGA